MDASEPYLEAPPEIRKLFKEGAPTRQQWEAISHPLTPCAVVAGAGSGKTAVMAARVVYLVLEGLAVPSQILCLTFTNKAAEELSRRVREAVIELDLPEGEEATVLTYHAFASKLLSDYGARAGLEPGQMLLSEAHRWQIVRSLLDDMTFDHLEVRTLNHVVRQTLEFAEQCADHCVQPEDVIKRDRALLKAVEAGEQKVHRDVKETAHRRLELAKLVAAYRDRKRAINTIDYGDQIDLALELVKKHPDIAADFRARYPVVLLDEYQDTNIAQARLLQALVGKGYPIFAVGDPDQNIYAWRGASLRNLLRFGDDFGNSGPGLPLYVNFRSGSRILDAANAVIGAVPQERRAPDKVLQPHPARGEGRVVAFVETDQSAEAERIADMILEAHERGGVTWGDVAILCRKKRLMLPIYEVLHARGIPAEVVDLGGLLQIPEVVDVVSWLRVIEDPSRNVALARILLGPRWRIGYRDVAALARWSAHHNKELSAAMPGEEEAPGDVTFALAESLDHLEEIESLSDEARERLRELREVLAGLRGAAHGPPADLIADVIERSGIARELDALTGDAAQSARLNLANFVEFVTSFSPLEGDATLSTLIGFLDVADDTEGGDFEIAQPSEADTVKLLTIHKAKGLEWPVVFVPGLAEHAKGGAAIFPDVSRQANPLTRPSTLPFDLRGDADVLPSFDGNLSRFKDALKERGLEEERRLCYVALTRARDLLVVSSAYWYEGPQDAHDPGRFYIEVSEGAEKGVQAAKPEVSPLIEARAARAGSWPRPGRDDDTDELFPEGWHAAAIEAVSAPDAVEERAASVLSKKELDTFRRTMADDIERAELIRARAVASGSPPLPSTLSVSSVIDYLRCPKLFYWSHVRPLPRRSSAAARLGTDIHRWIQTESSGQGTLIDLDEIPDLSLEERLGEPGIAARLRENWRRSRFASAIPLHIERPFLLWLDGMVVGGRIDAIFGEPDGAWEIVDYKTGRVPSDDDPLSGIQLDLYALAAIEVWNKKPADLTLTYFYVSEGIEVSRPAGDPDEIRARVTAALKEMSAGGFDATPGEQCRWCDFLAFCEPGRAHLGR